MLANLVPTTAAPVYNAAFPTPFERPFERLSDIFSEPATAVLVAFSAPFSIPLCIFVLALFPNSVPPAEPASAAVLSIVCFICVRGFFIFHFGFPIYPSPDTPPPKFVFLLSLTFFGFFLPSPLTISSDFLCTFATNFSFLFLRPFAAPAPTAPAVSTAAFLVSLDATSTPFLAALPPFLPPTLNQIFQ